MGWVGSSAAMCCQGWALNLYICTGLSQVTRRLCEREGGRLLPLKYGAFSRTVGCESLKENPVVIQPSPSALSLSCGGWSKEQVQLGQRSPVWGREGRFGKQLPLPGRAQHSCCKDARVFWKPSGDTLLCALSHGRRWTLWVCVQGREIWHLYCLFVHRGKNSCF